MALDRTDGTLLALGVAGALAAGALAAGALAPGSRSVEDDPAAFDRAIQRYARAARAHYAAGRHGSFLGNTWLLHGVLSRVRNRWGGAPQERGLWGAPRAIRDSYGRAEGVLTELLALNNRVRDGARRIVRVARTGFGGRSRRASSAAKLVRALDLIYPTGNSKGREALIRVSGQADELMAEDPGVRELYEELRGGAPLRELPEGFDLCGRCGGAGRIAAFSHIEGGLCFDCDGLGVVESGPAF